MSKKLILTILLCIVMMLSLVVAACTPDEPQISPDDPNHVHTYSEDWSADETYHWHQATCAHYDLRDGQEEHQLDDTGRCTVCNRQILVTKDGFTVYNDQSTTSDAMVLDPVPAEIAELSVAVHYRRLDSADYKHWGFWIWTAGQEGERFALSNQDDFGGVAYFKIKSEQTNARFGLIPINDDKTSGNSWYKKDSAGADRFFEPDNFILENNCYHLYLLEGDINIYHSVEESNYVNLNYGIKAQFTDRTNINMTFTSPITKVAVLEGDTVIAEYEPEDKTVHVAYEMPNDADIKKTYYVKVTFALNSFEKQAGVDITVFYDLAEFSENFYYEGDDLGATLGENSTTFKVWSPVSTRMILKLYNYGYGGDPFAFYDMDLGEKGVWEVTVPERLAGKYYTYTVYNGANPNGMEIVDPYAKSAGFNGVRGMVVDFNSGLVTPAGWDAVAPQPYNQNELVVWETHVADVTSSETWGGPEKLAKTFLGMIEPGTTYTDGKTTVKTGFDHILELGVNAVQLVPVFDQANDEEYVSFNWGYNPLNYNVIEGSYSTNCNDGFVRVMEFRQLVQAFAEHKINIIMDVVYNHVNEASNSNFEVLMPGYYFRHSADGSLSSDSGCGNDTMSERPMFRKFMIDSVCFLAKTYKLGGFRFDIMGLHDVETMNQLVTALRKINPDIVVYGEAWSNNKTSHQLMADQSNFNNSRFPEKVGQFNDRMRDQIKNFAAGDGVTSRRILDGFMGATTNNNNNGYITDDPFKTVNYVTCHDGPPLVDDFYINHSKRDDDGMRSTLSNSMVLTSNGISFILAGEEFLRSKMEAGGSMEQASNSYNAPYAVNALDYSRKIKYATVFENYCKLIEFKRKFVSEFGLDTKDNITAKYSVNDGNGDGAYYIDIASKDGTQWCIVHGGTKAPESISYVGFEVYWSTTGNNSTSTLQNLETKILFKK